VYRYLALIWNPADDRSRVAVRSLLERLEAGAIPWSRVLDSAGLAIFHADRNSGVSDAQSLAHSAGAILGKIFTHDIEDPAAAARVSFDDAESSRIVASGGRRLFERYWGRFVAIVRNAVTGAVWVLRDPSGGFPCWLTHHEGISVVCSDIEDWCALGVASFTVNWEYITGFVAHAGLQVRATALNEVSEIQGGERVRFCAGVIQRSIEWSPIDIARNAPLESAEEAVELLRTTTRGCVHAWASGYDGILHSLSGGLDSSIVLSCLKSAPGQPRITCLNYFAGGATDERRYARLMAQHANVELIEHQLDPESVRMEGLLDLRRSPRPWFYLYELEHGRFEDELSASRQASSIFSGGGGDGVFFQARPELAVTDYLFEHGLGAGLLRTAIDAGRVTRKSMWPLLLDALRARALNREWDPIAMAKPLPRTLVTTDAISAAKLNKGFAHPWLTPEATRGVSPGILWHIMCLSLPLAYYSSFTRSARPERTMPLVSQPLVELCLRIPSYVFIRSGRDRALARRAFAPDLPGEIVRRYTKGRADEHARNILAANINFARELLLDGELVRRGLLNKSILEKYLALDGSPGDVGPADFQYNEILQEHVCTEAWLRTWLTSSSGAPG
jgi:asparagine synthase (glutamine-hydrolysing)